MQGGDDYALGVDIGGTNTKIGLVNRAGEVSALRRFRTEAHGSDPGPFLGRLFEHTQAVLSAASGNVIGIGIATHGYTDEARDGPVVCGNTPALAGVKLRGLLSAHFGLPAVLNNDLIAHALAESHFGSGRDVRRFMCVAMGTGLGAGFIVDGAPLRIFGGTTGDPGRVILEPGGPPDAYGVRGSAEALCGVPAIERLAEGRYGRAVRAHEVIASAREGEPIAAEVMAQIGARLGHLVAILSVLFVPQRVAITGGTAEAGPVLLQACRARFEELVGDYHRTVASGSSAQAAAIKPLDAGEIVLGQMRGETGVVGAVVELLQRRAGEATDQLPSIT